MTAIPADMDVLSSDDLVGVLTRETRVRLVNISASGCLVESNSRLDPGISGALTIRVDGETYADDVRITRVQQVHGAGAMWHVGAEFLWTTQPGPASLRRVVPRLRPIMPQQPVEFEFTPRPM